MLLFPPPGASLPPVQPLPGETVDRLGPCVRGAAELQGSQAHRDSRHRHGDSGSDQAGVADTQLPEGAGGLQDPRLRSSRP